MQPITNKSLKKSLTLINRLLVKNLDFAYTQTILLRDLQTFVYPADTPQTTSISLNDDSVLPQVANNKQTYTSNQHPFKGLPSEIKSYTSTPLISTTQNTIGFLLLLDTKERSLSHLETSLLEESALIIADTIEKHEENQRLKEVFTDFMHKAIHDLKNPLTSISLTSELLKRKAEDPLMVISFCERLEKSNQRLLSNLEKLKSAFPVEDNNFKLTINEINIDDILSEIKSTSNSTNIITENHIKKNIYADRRRLKEAISFLVNPMGSNINTATEIKAYLKEKEAIIAIFNKENTDNSSTALTISKMLIEMHGGKIEVTQDSYYICLPFNTP